MSTGCSPSAGKRTVNTVTMKSSPNIIPQTQAYALIGGTLLLALCAGSLLISWRLGLLTTDAGSPQTAKITAEMAPSTVSTPEQGVTGEPAPLRVDNGALLQRLAQCRPECAGVDLALIDLGQNALALDGVNLRGPTCPITGCAAT